MFNTFCQYMEFKNGWKWDYVYSYPDIIRLLTAGSITLNYKDLSIPSHLIYLELVFGQLVALWLPDNNISVNIYSQFSFISFQALIWNGLMTYFEQLDIKETKLLATTLGIHTVSFVMSILNIRKLNTVSTLPAKYVAIHVHVDKQYWLLKSRSNYQIYSATTHD